MNTPRILGVCHFCVIYPLSNSTMKYSKKKKIKSVIPCCFRGFSFSSEQGTNCRDLTALGYSSHVLALALDI